mmetsp:Transcript_1575/g.3943  ORF Transcript_1575/g.3943 Transcript_1575/m.3943 type:complete len:239 (-) Transcript_1575:99-815(-)
MSRQYKCHYAGLWLTHVLCMAHVTRRALGGADATRSSFSISPVLRAGDNSRVQSTSIHVVRRRDLKHVESLGYETIVPDNGHCFHGVGLREFAHHGVIGVVAGAGSLEHLPGELVQGCLSWRALDRAAPRDGGNEGLLQPHAPRLSHVNVPLRARAMVLRRREDHELRLARGEAGFVASDAAEGLRRLRQLRVGQPRAERPVEPGGARPQNVLLHAALRHREAGLRRAAEARQPPGSR